MLNRLIAWYTAISLTRRRVALTVLVPAAEYAGLEPVRHGVNGLAKISPALGLAMLPVLLAVMVLMAAVIVLFVLECFRVLSRTRARWIATLGLLGIYAWVLMPLFLMRFIAD